MPFVVTFKDFTPPAKYDSQAWTGIQIEESAAAIGPWSVIDNIAISPLDADPVEPESRDFTTVNAQLQNGWYRITFIDAVNSTASPTDPIHNVEDDTAPYLPTLADVGALMRARTVDNLGAELGTFTAKTRPTGQQVLDLLQQAADDVTAGIDTDIPPGAYRYAKQAIIYKAAMMIELAYWPEQINSGRSPYPQYSAQFDAFFINLKSAVEREQVEATEGESAKSAGMANYEFPLRPTIGSARW